MAIAVLFDVDGTLLKDTRAHKTAFSRAFRDVFHINTTIDAIDHHGMTDQQIIMEVLKKSGIPEEEILLNMKECTKRMVQHFKEELKSEDVHLLPEVRETLSYLKEKEVLLGLATGNIKEIAESKLKKASIYNFFSFGGFGSDAIKRVNLVKKAIERAQKISGNIPLKNIFLVGDTIYDISAGKSAGINTIAVATGSYSLEMLKDADLALSSLKEKGRLLNFITKQAEVS